MRGLYIAGFAVSSLLLFLLWYLWRLLATIGDVEESTHASAHRPSAARRGLWQRTDTRGTELTVLRQAEEQAQALAQAV